MSNSANNTYMISGGGTGGHIYPAIAVAQEIVKNEPNAKILFVGANGRMEMTIVPKYGFEIVGLDIMGINRSQVWKNIVLPLKLIKSYLKVSKLINQYKPIAVAGFGGFASAPLVFVASKKGIPILVQEQNAIPGVTNKTAGKNANKVCVAYPNLEKYFPNSSVVNTGNPIRDFTPLTNYTKQTALSKLGLSPSLPTVFIMGGSLGANTFNQAVINNLTELEGLNINILWQTGKVNYDTLMAKIKNHKLENIKPLAYIEDMDAAYTASDVIISRAGAISISELAIIGKPVILVPSPNVAGDHQTKNAEAIANKNGCIFIKDNIFEYEFINQIKSLLSNPEKQKELGDAIKIFAKPNATRDIYKELLKLTTK